MICLGHRRFHAVGWLAPAVLCSLVGCGLLDELLPTSSDSEEPGVSSESPASPSSTGSSPTTPSPFPSPTTGVSAPEIHSPAPGSEVVGTQPNLVVDNSSTGDQYPVIYAFELASDAGFTELVAAANNIDQGSQGRTSWQVPEVLGPGQYFWRARAQAGYVKSAYSSVADFVLVEQVAPPGPAGGGDVLIVDALTDGASIGEVHGGMFTSQGWKVTSKSDFIRYEISPLASGFVEWENLGLQPANPRPDQFMLFGMWDPTQGDYRANPFRVHVQKLDTNHNPPYIRLRWIANGEQHDTGYNFTDWDPEQVYQWRIEWGPLETANEVQVLLNGQVIIQQTYRRVYKPVTQWVELGLEERVESIVGAIYFNVRIGDR